MGLPVLGPRTVARPWGREDRGRALEEYGLGRSPSFPGKLPLYPAPSPVAERQ